MFGANGDSVLRSFVKVRFAIDSFKFFCFLESLAEDLSCEECCRDLG